MCIINGMYVCECNCDHLKAEMLSVISVSPGSLIPVLDTDVAHKCLHGMNPHQKAVLRGKRLEKSNLRD